MRDGSRAKRARCWRLTWLPGPGRKQPMWDMLEREPAPQTKARKRMERGLRVLKAYRKDRDLDRLPVLDCDTFDALPPISAPRRYDSRQTVEWVSAKGLVRVRPLLGWGGCCGTGPSAPLARPVVERRLTAKRSQPLRRTMTVEANIDESEAETMARVMVAPFMRHGIVAKGLADKVALPGDPHSIFRQCHQSEAERRGETTLASRANGELCRSMPCSPNWRGEPP